MVSISANYRLPKNEILRGRDKFNNVFKKGAKISGSFIFIFYLLSNDKKVGFAVSKKVRRAVARNRLKRVLRDIYRLNKNVFPDNFHYVLLANGVSDNFHDLNNEVLALAKKINHKKV